MHLLSQLSWCGRSNKALPICLAYPKRRAGRRTSFSKFLANRNEGGGMGDG